jgi:hypothetical protein
VVAVTGCFGIATICFDFIAILMWQHRASKRNDAVAEGALFSLKKRSPQHLFILRFVSWILAAPK